MAVTVSTQIPKMVLQVIMVILLVVVLAVCLEESDNNTSPNHSLMASDIITISSSNGTLFGADVESRDIIWSVSTGLLLTYHKVYLPNRYCDVKDDQFLYIKDWKLKAYQKQHGFKILPKKLSEMVKDTPKYLSNGTVILGSKGEIYVAVMDLRSGEIFTAFFYGVDEDTRRNGEPLHFYGVDEDRRRNGEPLHFYGVDEDRRRNGEPLHFNLSTQLPYLITWSRYCLQSYAYSIRRVDWYVCDTEIDVRAICASKNCDGFSNDLTYAPKKKVHRLLADTEIDNYQNRLPFYENYWFEKNNNTVSLPRHMGNISFRFFDDQYEKESICYPEPFLGGIIIFTVVLAFIAVVTWRNFGYMTEVESSRNNAEIIHESDVENKIEGSNNTVITDESNNTVITDESNMFTRIGQCSWYTGNLIHRGRYANIFKGTYGETDCVVKYVEPFRDQITPTQLDCNYDKIHKLRNIVKYYGMECRGRSVVIALEHCTGNLRDFIITARYFQHEETNDFQQRRRNLPFHNVFSELKLKLWIVGDNGQYPSQPLLELIKDVVKILRHYHAHGNVYECITPQDIYISTELGLCAKLPNFWAQSQVSKFGPRRQLNDVAREKGSRFRSPETLGSNVESSASSNMFTLGCVLYFCLCEGAMPFRRGKAMKSQIDSMILTQEHFPEAHDLLTRLLEVNANLRPSAEEVLDHPIFWGPQRCFEFMKIVSDKLKREGSQSNLCIAFEKIKDSATTSQSWPSAIDEKLLDAINSGRRNPSTDSLYNLLRGIRNLYSHFHEQEKDVKELLGSPVEVEAYFRKKFPRLFLEIYKFVRGNWKNDTDFSAYFPTYEISASMPSLD